MGQKVHPESIRVGYIHDWKSNWFNERNFADYLHEDTQIRGHIIRKLSHAGLSDITIRKNATEVEVNIHTARPGIVIGKSGSEVDQLRRDLHRMTSKQVKVNILEIKRPELDSRLVAQSIAEQLQNRVAFRRAMKRALTSAMRSSAAGATGAVAGRAAVAEGVVAGRAVVAGPAVPVGRAVVAARVAQAGPAARAVAADRADEEAAVAAVAAEVEATAGAEAVLRV